MLIHRLHACVLSHFSCVRLFVTPRTVAYQAPLSMDSPGKSTGVGAMAFSAVYVMDHILLLPMGLPTTEQAPSKYEMLSS